MRSNEMSLFQTTIMVTKNVIGLTVVAANGILRAHITEAVGLAALAGFLYLIF
jgi:hypothetical protein